MYGVILWSDADVGKAVIWCEDHGDLAYYEAPPHVADPEQLFFDPGDYVEFDLTVEDDLRRASNAQTILAASYPMVAHTLDGVGSNSHRLPIDEGAATSAHVINLSDHMRGRTPYPEVSRRG